MDRIGDGCSEAFQPGLNYFQNCRTLVEAVTLATRNTLSVVILSNPSGSLGQG